MNKVLTILLFVAVTQLLSASSFAQTASLADADKLFDFSETFDPELFGPPAESQQLNVADSDWYLRAFSNSGVLLAVNVNGTGPFFAGDVFILGGPFGSDPTFLGKLADLNAFVDLVTGDDDEDGVVDADDQCPATPAGESTNSKGCSALQLGIIVTQEDADKLFDFAEGLDAANFSPPTSTQLLTEQGSDWFVRTYTYSGISLKVNINGTGDLFAGNVYAMGGPLGDEEIFIDTLANLVAVIDSLAPPDGDDDGVPDDMDQCLDTAVGQSVNGQGCSDTQLDDDNDGVSNALDQCADTPAGEAVNPQGCGASQLDDDNDGVFNNLDQCPDTPLGESVSGNGCGTSQLDSTITSQPQSLTLETGQTANFSVSATGTAPLTYQWQRADEAQDPFLDIEGATTSAFTIAAVDADDNGARFRVAVSNVTGTIISNEATLNLFEAPPGLQLRTQFGSTDELEVVTDGIFAIWWDPKFDHSADTEEMFQYLNNVRADALLNLGLQDPPNPAAGYYYNVYIHHGEDDLFPAGWGNGQGTDMYGMPFLALPDGAHLSIQNISHEGFHVFQYNGNSPGFAYSGDSQWYAEATAQWYSVTVTPDELTIFREAGAITANPQLALWHSFGNEAPGDPTDWFYWVRQYGMHTLLYYLTAFAGVNENYIVDGFYRGVTLSPQQYLYDSVGGEQLRDYFADWAARNTGGFDYLTSEQADFANLEAEFVGDPNNSKPYAIELSGTDANGEFTPPLTLAPRGWAYNVIRISNSSNTSYGFKFQGAELGSECAASHFEARVVVVGNGENKYSNFEMQSPTLGTSFVEVNALDSDVYVVIAAVPEHFSGNQFYDYSIAITQGGNAGDEENLELDAMLYSNPNCAFDPEDPDYSDFFGTYVREPYENLYHQGEISFSDENLIWTNEANLSWNLIPFANAPWVFATSGSPYDGNNGSEFRFVFPTPTSRTEAALVEGFYFLNEFYVRQ